MDTVINQISEVESAASAIMDEAINKKSLFAKEMDARTAAFDKQLEAETEKKIQVLRARMEIEIKEKLAKQKETAEHMQTAMIQNYDEQHTAYVEKLFQSLTEE